METKSMNAYIRLQPIGRAIYLPDLRRFRESTGIGGAGDGANHSSMTSCGIRVLVTLWVC